jgi:hypothetical protein
MLVVFMVLQIVTESAGSILVLSRMLCFFAIHNECLCERFCCVLLVSRCKIYVSDPLHVSVIQFVFFV